ncbi:MAG: 4-hydroxy-3-methylbut-2-enyl diphosphate reductase [Fuerstiella sp.]|nr:4-hydroxy-3-methylbut-2-enyl diphosphate reductase [Fuerstiella sp.]MCP4512990.1 4-hydroxy-3-methylbut-2-enyl diphosphate reductase [Fuerstiella sp.]
MKILLVNPRGFCAGVNMAIECLDEAIRRVGPGIYVYHEIVHNKYVVDRFTKQGVTFVDSMEEVPHGSILLFSAHGVSPEIRSIARQRNLQTVDATCPLVTKVHLEAIRYANAGYHIILIGHEGHDEVIGTMGEAPESITLVETPSDVDKLPFSNDDRLAYLTQTTLSVAEATEVIGALKNCYPGIESPKKEDICYATTNRQDAVKMLVESADVLIVLGSQNSSNSRRLMEIGASQGVPSYLVDGSSELQTDWFERDSTVVITAGASAPEVVVEECINYLRTHFDAEVSEEMLRKENVHFSLPKELHQLSGK